MKTRIIKKLSKLDEAISYYESKFDEAPKEIYEYRKKLLKRVKHEN